MLTSLMLLTENHHEDCNINAIETIEMTNKSSSSYIIEGVKTHLVDSAVNQEKELEVLLSQ